MPESADYFQQFARQTIGHDAFITTPYGQLPLIYADWAASGRLYLPIEQKLLDEFGPLVANTHTESNACGEAMTLAYHEAKHIIKKHASALDTDVLIPAGSGMTSAVTLLQRMLGWRLPERFQAQLAITEAERPVVFVSELEHHSNHTTWIETIADVVLVPSSTDEPMDLKQLEALLDEYSSRKTKVAAVTAASNVTGVRLPIHDIAEIMHRHGGLCFVDYTCAAPYDEITMNPLDPLRKLDALYFSPHKFLGGPGSPGILLFDRALYKNAVPDRPGGGTVLWTNPWGGRHYYEDIETREDGGTPPFLGLIKAALAIRLKEKIGITNIKQREEVLVEHVFEALSDIPRLSLLDGTRKDRLALFAITIDDLHYNLVTRLLNDRFGIEVRGGCACAGTYGHCLFKISPDASKAITDLIDTGDISQKPGFTRISFHPMMSDETVDFIISAVKQIAEHGTAWAKDYAYDAASNEFINRQATPPALPLGKVFNV